MDDPKVMERIRQFKLIVAERLNDRNFTDHGAMGPEYLEDIEDSEEERRGRELGMIPTDEEYGKMIQRETKEADEYGDGYDEYVGAKIRMDIGGEELVGTLVKRQKGLDGRPIGRRHNNPLFDTRTYSVRFPGGVLHEYTANVVAENLHAQLDSEGKRHLMMKEIIGHRKNGDAVSREDGFTISSNGNKHPKRTTKGWQIAVEWKNGNQEWVPLKDMKEGYAVELAEYAVAQGIEQEPAFHWWVPQVLNHLRRSRRSTGKQRRNTGSSYHTPWKRH